MMEHETKRRAVPWTVKDALLAYALVVFVSLLAIEGLNPLLSREPSDEITPLVTLILILLQGMLILAVWVFGVKRYRVPWATLGLVRASLRWTLVLPWLGVLLSFTFAGAYAIVVTAAGLESLQPPPIPEGALGDGPARLVNIGVIGVLGPVAEEIFFRGFLLATLAGRMGALTAAIVASAMFAALHLSIAVMLPVFVSGMILSWLYLKTRSIWPPLLAHSGQNLIVLALAS